MEMVVVFPAPLGPSRPTISPRRRARLIPLRDEARPVALPKSNRLDHGFTGRHFFHTEAWGANKRCMYREPGFA